MEGNFSLSATARDCLSFTSVTCPIMPKSCPTIASFGQYSPADTTGRLGMFTRATKACPDAGELVYVGHHLCAGPKLLGRLESGRQGPTLSELKRLRYGYLAGPAHPQRSSTDAAITRASPAPRSLHVSRRPSDLRLTTTRLDDANVSRSQGRSRTTATTLDVRATHSTFTMFITATTPRQPKSKLSGIVTFVIP